jgi:hypothetical protein
MTTRERRVKQLMKRDWIERTQFKKGIDLTIYLGYSHHNNEEGD